MVKITLDSENSEKYDDLVNAVTKLDHRLREYGKNLDKRANIIRYIKPDDNAIHLVYEDKPIPEKDFSRPQIRFFKKYPNVITIVPKKKKLGRPQKSHSESVIGRPSNEVQKNPDWEKNFYYQTLYEFIFDLIKPFNAELKERDFKEFFDYALEIRTNDIMSLFYKEQMILCRNVIT